MSETLEPPLSIPAEIHQPRIDVSRRRLLLAAALLVLWGVLCRALSAEWAVNEQYSYGWFVPIFAVYFFWSRWERRPQPHASESHGLRWSFVAIALLACLLPIRFFEVAAPDWRLPLWIHALIATTLTLLVLQRGGGTRWVRHFAFPIGFFLLAVPWPLRIETPVVQGLMRWVASLAAETITLFGIPAEVRGNLIHINGGTVGVNEACSGIRSLQTSLMIGLLLGELKSLSPRRRVYLVLAAVVIALSANFGRAVVLVWIAASRGIDAVADWHDALGYSIVVAVFLGCLLCLKFISRSSAELPRRSRSPIATTARIGAVATSFVVVGLGWLAFTEVSVEAWYRWHERGSVMQPRWTVEWPQQNDRFTRLPVDEYAHRQLRYDTGEEAAWMSGDDRYVAFFLRWNAGRSSILRARAHRPEICLPGAGLQQIGDNGTKTYFVAAGLTLPFRHFIFKLPAGASLHFADAFFCVSEDRSVPHAADVRAAESRPSDSWSDTTRDFAAMVRAGIRNPGQQVLEIIRLSPHYADPAQSEADFAALLPRIIKVEHSAQSAQASR